MVTPVSNNSARKRNNELVRPIRNPRSEIRNRMNVILETDRLLLREYVKEDAEAFFRLNSDPEVLRFVPDPEFPP